MMRRFFSCQQLLTFSWLLITKNLRIIRQLGSDKLCDSKLWGIQIVLKRSEILSASPCQLNGMIKTLATTLIQWYSSVLKLTVVLIMFMFIFHSRDYSRDKFLWFVFIGKSKLVITWIKNEIQNVSANGSFVVGSLIITLLLIDLIMWTQRIPL